jgi:ubiquinone/menaquinone biosynthesis C-methylase UbiE
LSRSGQDPAEEVRRRFDEAAAEWDAKPRRVALARAVGQAILETARPSATTEALDYGCGTGLVALYLAPHVHSVVGADSSDGMLQVLRHKIEGAGVENMSALRLELERDPIPAARYDLITTSMTLHHMADTTAALTAFHNMLRPSGKLCVADLDIEPGVFHGPDPGSSGVHHFGFERGPLKDVLRHTGFHDLHDQTVFTISKEVEGGKEMDFPVFLITATRP